MLFKMLINILVYSLYTVFPCLLLVLFIHGSVRVVLPIFAGLYIAYLYTVFPCVLLWLFTQSTPGVLMLCCCAFRLCAIVVYSSCCFMLSIAYCTTVHLYQLAFSLCRFMLSIVIKLLLLNSRTPLRRVFSSVNVCSWRRFMLSIQPCFWPLLYRTPLRLCCMSSPVWSFCRFASFISPLLFIHGRSVFTVLFLPVHSCNFSSHFRLYS